MDNLFSIYLFKVRFKDKNESKERPIVTLFYNNQLLSFEVAGIYKERNKYAKNPYYKDFMYKIIDHEYANLNYPSYINVARPFTIPFTALLGKESIGKLSDRDAKGVLTLYNHYWSKTQED